jgi:hypothetical protein
VHIVEGDPEKPFFEQNPELRYIPEIKVLIDKHGESKAGYYMWATYMFEDPRSKIYKVPLDEKKVIILENYLKVKDSTTNLEDIEKIRYSYPNIILTKTQVLYKGYADQMDEYMVYTKSLPIATHADKKLSYLEKLTKMWPTYEKITEKMNEEEASIQTRKGIVESPREKRASKQ